MKTIKTEIINYNGQKRIKLLFDYDKEIINKIKKLPDCRWSQDLRAWHIRYIENHINYLNITFKDDLDFREIITQQVRQPISEIKNKTFETIYYEEVPEEWRIYIKIQFNRTIISLIKTLDGYRWHKARKLWSIRGGKLNFEEFKEVFQTKGYILRPARIYESDERPQLNICTYHKEVLPDEFIRYIQLRNFSERTVKVHCSQLARFLAHFKDLDIQDLEQSVIQKLIKDHIDKNNYSHSYQNQMISAIKLYYKVMFNRDFNNIELPRPKKEKRLPIILSREEITRIIDVTLNQKHRAIIILTYATGLRVGEVVRIKVSNIDWDRKLIHIQAGKGKKDRIVPIQEKLYRTLKEYIRRYRPVIYLFEGVSGFHYSERSVQKFLKRSLQRAGIIKKATMHTLRHSFATHLIEEGTDLFIAKEMMGHKDIKTTEMYLHLSNRNILNFRSPLEDLDI